MPFIGCSTLHGVNPNLKKYGALYDKKWGGAGDDAMELHPKYDRAPISNPEMYE